MPPNRANDSGAFVIRLLRLGIQLCVNVGVLPNGISATVLPEKDVFPEVRFPRKAQRLEQMPGIFIFRVTFGKNTVRALCKAALNQRRTGLLCKALSPIRAVKDIAKLQRRKIPATQIDVSDQTVRFRKFNGNHFI